MSIKKFARGECVSGNLTGSLLDWSGSIQPGNGNPIGLKIEADAIISVADWKEFVGNIDELIAEAERTNEPS